MSNNLCIEEFRKKVLPKYMGKPSDTPKESLSFSTRQAKTRARADLSREVRLYQHRITEINSLLKAKQFEIRSLERSRMNLEKQVLKSKEDIQALTIELDGN